MTTKKKLKQNKEPTKGNFQSVSKKEGKKVTVKDLDNPTLSELEPVILDAGKRYKVVEYIEFVKWTALATFDRDPDTQGEFSKKYKVSEQMLSRWKTSTEFWEDVSRIRKAYMHDDFGDIIKALKKNIIINGRGQDVKVYAQVAGIMKEDGDGTLALSPALEDTIKKISNRLPD